MFRRWKYPIAQASINTTSCGSTFMEESFITMGVKWSFYRQFSVTNRDLVMDLGMKVFADGAIYTRKAVSGIFKVS